MVTGISKALCSYRNSILLCKYLASQKYNAGNLMSSYATCFI